VVRANIRAIVLAALHLSCQRSDPRQGGVATLSEPAAPGEARAGTSIRTAYYQIRSSAPQDCSHDERDAPATGARRVGVEIWLEPTGSLQVPANPYYAKLVDGDGNVYEATLGGCGPPLAPTLPSRGQPARGWIVFDVPRSARGLTLTYTPELVGATQSEVVIQLTAKAPRTP
jgi:hypothetical protein